MQTIASLAWGAGRTSSRPTAQTFATVRSRARPAPGAGTGSVVTRTMAGCPGSACQLGVTAGSGCRTPTVRGATGWVSTRRGPGCRPVSWSRRADPAGAAAAPGCGVRDDARDQDRAVGAVRGAAAGAVRADRAAAPRAAEPAPPRRGGPGRAGPPPAGPDGSGRRWRGVGVDA